MKNNKLITVLLALLVCLSMVISASANTENALSFTLESADSSVENFNAGVVTPGEKFSVNVVVESNPGVTYCYVDVIYDSSVLKLDAEACEFIDGVKFKDTGDFIRIVIGDANAVEKDVEPVTATGVIAKLTFEVLVETDVKSALELECDASYALDANGDRNSLTVSGDKLDINVAGTEHVCDENNTVEANNATAPDCTNTGKETDLLCAHCGKLVAEGEVIPALGHTAGEVVKENEVAADCVNAGSYDNVVYCTVCEAEVSRETVEIPALGHTEVVDEAVGATCTTTGLTEGKHCSVCNEILTAQEEVPTLGHTAGEVVKENEVAGDCVNNGSYDNVTYCTVCQAEVTRETVTVAAAGHKIGAAVIENEIASTCTDRGSYEIAKYCTVCNAEVSRVYQSSVATGHAWGEWVVTTPATCEKFGVQTRTCKNCGEEDTDEAKPLAEHKFGEWTTKTEPTVDAEGLKVRTCSGCGAEETEVLAKLPPVVDDNNDSTLIIVIVVIVVLAGAGVGAYFILKNKKK